MRGRRSYGRRVGYPRATIRKKLQQAKSKLNTAEFTIRLENSSLKDPDYDPGTDLITEADRIKSAREEIGEALKLLDGS